MQYIKLLYHVDKAEHSGNELRNNSSPACAHYAHVQHQYHEKVKADVEQARQYKEVQRGLGIADGTYDSRQNVVKERYRNSQEYHEYVVVRLLEAVRGGVHPGQDIRAEQAGRGSQHHGEYHGDPDGVSHVFSHRVEVLRAEHLRHRNRESGAHALDESQHQEVYRAGRAYACKRVYSEELPDYSGVHHVIELLKQHSEEQRQHESEYKLHRGACGEVFC